MYKGHTKYIAAYNSIQRTGDFANQLILTGIGAMLSKDMKMSFFPRVIGLSQALQAFDIRRVIYADYLTDKIDASLFYPCRNTIFLDDLSDAEVPFSAV